MNHGQLEHVSCNLCGSDTPELLFTVPETLDVRQGIVRCRACGLVYRNIRLNEKELCSNYEKWGEVNLSPERISGRKEVFEANSKLIEPFRWSNRVLDVGAGGSFFLGACADRGWDCYGVEPSRQTADYARRNFGLSLTCGRFENSAYPGGHFDAVTFLNVLESLPDPKRALKKAHQLLRPGGAVTVRFTNATFHVAAYKFFLFMGCLHLDTGSCAWHK